MARPGAAAAAAAAAAAVAAALLLLQPLLPLLPPVLLLPLPLLLLLLPLLLLLLLLPLPPDRLTRRSTAGFTTPKHAVGRACYRKRNTTTAEMRALRIWIRHGGHGHEVVLGA